MALIYLAGFLATIVVGRLSARTVPSYQRLPLSNHVLLGALWPLYLTFLVVTATIHHRSAS